MCVCLLFTVFRTEGTIKSNVVLRDLPKYNIAGERNVVEWGIILSRNKNLGNNCLAADFKTCTTLSACPLVDGLWTEDVT